MDEPATSLPTSNLPLRTTQPNRKMSSVDDQITALSRVADFLKATEAARRTRLLKLTHDVLVTQLAIFIKIKKIAADLETSGKQTMTSFADYHIASIQELWQGELGEGELEIIIASAEQVSFRNFFDRDVDELILSTGRGVHAIGCRCGKNEVGSGSHCTIEHKPAYSAPHY